MVDFFLPLLTTYTGGTLNHLTSPRPVFVATPNQQRKCYFGECIPSGNIRCASLCLFSTRGRISHLKRIVHDQCSKSNRGGYRRHCFDLEVAEVNEERKSCTLSFGRSGAEGGQGRKGRDN